MDNSKTTAGRDALGGFAPKFAQLNDEVLFGQVWAREEQLSPRDRSLITVAALMGSGVLDSSLQHHIQRAKGNGITREEMAEALTHLAFYAGWPKAWAVFRMAKEIYGE
ncbi:carboxymuconolactone decarboxylase family protein [Ruminococcaceae bacterium OttesenSCG-928-O06]|nr:carboxymuconolactone decarboxylase family protein [Ruminococcaceae bacterium OttesenSCG-928-O06]